MSEQSPLEESRRQFLLNALRAGALGLTASLLPRITGAATLGKVPRELPTGQSIYDMHGTVKINGTPANLNSIIRNNDVIQTDKNSDVTFVVGKDAFILRANSTLELSGDNNLLVSGLRLVTGAVLSVFGKTRHHISTSNAVIGIRGTGIYVEAEPELTYVCTCYGTVEIAAADDPTSQETIVSKHHDAPRYISSTGPKGKRIQSAPFKNHTDLELMIIETLVGRTPPFALFDEGYGSPRRY
jgi:hypothetical protein